MSAEAEPSVRFDSDRVDGWPDVTELTVFRDRLEVVTEGRRVIVRFADIARWPDSPRWPDWYRSRWGWWWRLRRWVGWRPRVLLVARRYWPVGGDPAVFEFYTEPELALVIPPETGKQTTPDGFIWVLNTLAAGGFGASNVP